MPRALDKSLGRHPVGSSTNQSRRNSYIMARISHEDPRDPATSSASAVRPSTSSITSKRSNLRALATDDGEVDDEDSASEDEEEDDAPGMVHMATTRGWPSASSI